MIKTNGDTRPNGYKDNSDPTANVLQLVAAAVDRLEDLRISETRRIDDLMALRAEHAKELTMAEAKRIDAIRAVDVNAVSVASERATQQASVLASQVASSAEALRALVATTADTIAKQLTAITSQLTERLAALEKASYEGTGKSRVVDPQLELLMNEVKFLRERQATKQGSGDGMKALWGLIAGLILLVIAVTGLLLKLQT